MKQENIREHNSEEYTVEEAAAWLKELDDRTRSAQERYNAIDELATKTKALEIGKTDKTEIGNLNTHLLNYFNQELNA